MENVKYRWIWIIVVIIIIIVIIWAVWDMGRKFISTLSGSQVVPPVDTLASGGITFRLNSNETNLSYSGNIKDVPFSAIKSISLHKGKMGENGSLVSELEFRSEKAVKVIVEGELEVSEELADMLKSKEIYSLATFKSGMIRGQLIPC